jgi:transposase-like protein
MLDMSKVVRFLRGRTSLLLVVYGAFLYFCTHSSRVASRALSSMVRRSHTSTLSWFRSLSFLFVDRSLRGKVGLLLIDDTRVEVGGREQALLVAFEPILRRIVYMSFFEAANIFAALTFMKRVKALYRSRMKILTDGAQYYRTACKFLNLEHDVYGLRLRNLMERIVQYVKDRTRDFDDYIPCRRGRCDKRHAQMLLSSIGFMINEVYLNEGFDLKEFLEKTISIIEEIKNA